MNIKQIRYFASVYALGSLSAAAKEQYVTVQAVSKAIADLERELKADLFVRESRGVRPTPFGKSFFLRAEPVLRSFKELEEFAMGGGSGKASLRLALCTPPFHGHEQACASMAAFIRKNLGIPTMAQVESVQTSIEKLRNGLLDAAFTIGPCEHEGIDCIPIGTVTPAILMAPDHPLARKQMISIADLEPYTVAVSGDFETFNNAIVEEYTKRGVRVKYVNMTAEDFEGYLDLRQGLAFAAGIPALGAMWPHSVMRLFTAEDAVALPICLASPQANKSPAYLAMEHWLANQLRVLGGDSFKKIAAMATSMPNAARP